MKEKKLLLSAAMSLAAVIGLMGLLGNASPARTAPPVQSPHFSSLQNTSPVTRYVSITGTDSSNDCIAAANPCATIQHAVSVAQSGDLILVSGGVFSTSGSLVPAVVQVSGKSLSFRGGYTTSFAMRNPEAWPTIVDGKNAVRGFSVLGSEIGPANVIVALDGFHIRNGYGDGSGGGIYVSEATLILTDTHIYNNVGAINPALSGAGGGLYAVTATLYISGCSFSHNTAHRGSGSWGMGGGLYLTNGTADIRYSTFYSNIARIDSMGYGGGMYLENCKDCLIAHNVIRYNQAGKGQTASGKGGGICVNQGDRVIIRDNEIAENIAAQYGSGDLLTQGEGGGLRAYGGRGLVVEGNRFLSNTATLRCAEGGIGIGGGFSLWGSYLSPISVTVRSNLFQGNVANQSGRGMGGAMFFLWVHTVQVEANTLISNTATVSDAVSWWPGGGGGLYVSTGRNLTLDNNIVAANRAGGESWGDGISLYDVRDTLFRHNTLAENGPNGVYLTATYGITFINTIVATHTVGITASETAHALLDHTLWYGNEQNTGGPGTITDTGGIVGPPDFVDPARWNYHIGPSSWAIDRGTDARVNTDIDGDNRPQDNGFDIGADEARWFRLYLPVVLKNHP